MSSTSATITLAPGPNTDEDRPKPPSLESQVQQIPRSVPRLEIQEETPSDADWAQLGAHFTSIKDLTLSSGFNEHLNDSNIPLHWPLERLVLNSACGELSRTQWIRDARLRHLRLEFTMGLRFGGPANEELEKAYDERVARGEEEEYRTSNGIRIVCLPALVQRWFEEKYAQDHRQDKQNEEGSSENPSQHELSSNIETLEIIENDVHDVLLRLCLSLPRVFSTLKTLNLRATNGCDFHYGSDDVLHQLLPQLDTLKTLTLTLGSEYSDPAYLTRLYRHLPPNLGELRFRGAARLAKSDAWPEWVRAFQDPGFLPQLQRLSFLLDLGQKVDPFIASARKQQRESESGDSVQQPENENPADEKHNVSTEDLRLAKRACEQIWKAAGERLIAVEPFSEDYPAEFPDQKPLDDRWEGL
ncbi:hypothetical protein PHISP_07810 [Aspergillus sp. HF37]|nr:hypothetical protein PHISP_07810 [Aspergillus sp. HF37]